MFEKLKSRRGDTYLWFIITTMCILVAFGVVFSLAEMQLEAYNIRRDMDDAIEVILGNVRKNPYKYLALGSTENTYTGLTATQISNILADELGAEIVTSPTASGTQFVVKDGVGNTKYTISDVQTKYIANIVDKNAVLTSSYGDINGDGKITETDREQVSLLSQGKTSSATLTNADLNGDGVVNGYDVGIMDGLLLCYEVSASQSKVERQSTAVIVISVRLVYNLEFGALSLGQDNSVYSFSTVLSFSDGTKLN